MASVTKEKKYSNTHKTSDASPAAEAKASYEAIVQMGWSSYKAGLRNKSVEYFIKALGMQADTMKQAVVMASQSEDFARLLEQDKNTLLFDPGNKLVNENLALIYYCGKQYAEALPYLQKVEKYYPFDYNNNLVLGWTYAHLGNKEAAANHFKTALLHSTGDAAITEGLAFIGSIVAADDALLQAFTKSNALEKIADYKGAIAALKEAYDANSYVINLRLGSLYHLKRSEDESLKYYKIASALKPLSAETRE